MKTDISLIIPIHKLDDSVSEYFEKAIKSVNEQKTLPDEVLIVHAKNKKLKDFLNSFEYGDISSITKVVENKSGDYDFQSQINYGVEQSTSKYFSFLEYDDSLSPIWFDNVVKYRDAYPEVGVFLPIIFECNENGEFISFTNENVWVQNVSESMGLLDHETLQKIQNFNFDGMVVNKELFKEHGGLKKHMKLTFTYEFLLRLSYLDVQIMVIPKLGYKHINNRAGSLFDEYKNNINVIESKFWVNKAKKEYFFTEDREITYEAETT
tara:strand:+ start:2087 stop:2884 length:798 start_codon:yes stop_codon:yes gene_type:complete